MPGRTRTINNISGDGAGRKRSRREADQDGDEEDIVDVREASSALQSETRRKRARVSMGKQPARSQAARNSSESSSEEGEDVVMEEAARNNNEPPATQYDLMRDNGFAHLQHADEDDKRFTQRIERRQVERQSNRADAAMSRAADNGILESIHCVNFMCHESLHITLGPHLNFIVGENGSGKSAILTAITICLGGKASSTNRGGSLKAFIKEGQHEAVVIVKIKNQGEDAYNPLLYGDTIIVERRFNRNGNNSFKIKSANEKVISTLKKEITNIVEYFSLQVDNPLNVLSQDNARQFLNQSSAKQKYKFFVQGVQLQQLDDEYRVMEELLNSSENKEGDLEVKLDNTRQDYERAKKDYQLYAESEKMRQQHRLLRQKLAWSQVAGMERKLTENEDHLVQVDGIIEDAQRNVDEKTQQLERLDEQILQAEQEVATVREENGGLQANVDKAQQEYGEAKKDLEKLANEQRDSHSRVAGAKQNVNDYERMVREEEQRLQDLNGDAHTRKTEELEAARARRDEIIEESNDAQRRIPDLNRDIDNAQKELTTVDQLMTQKKNDITKLQNRIRDLEKGQGSLYDAYEPQMRQLLRRIEEDDGFERKPVGPMGAHIKVLQPIWSPMLEKMFGESLNAFVVTSRADQQRLKGMMTSLRIGRSPIIIGNPRPIDCSRNEPDENFDTVLRILKIDDPLIRNQLIINNRIEKTILVQDHDEAGRIMYSAAPPRNVAACFHLFPKRGLGWTVRLTVNANGINSSPTPPPYANQRPRLQSDSHQETSMHKQELGQVQIELKDLQNQRSDHQKTGERCRKEIAAIKKTVDRSKQRVREMQVEIERIQGELDAFDGEDGRLDTLRSDLSKAKEDLEHFGGQYGTVGLRKAEQSTLCESLREDLKKEKAKQREFEPRLKKAEDKVTRGNELRRIALLAKNEAHDAHAVALNEKRRHEAKRDSYQQTVAEWTAEAQRICDRVHCAEDETYDLIVKKLDSLDKILKERERRRGMTDDQVRQRLKETQEATKSLEEAYDNIKNDIRALKRAHERRLARWRLFQRFISSSSRANFMFLLAERQYRGKLILDHKHHTLDVQVEPDNTRKNAAARKTNTLSGGEKSFSSICLLLAIWEAMGSPLRCLDEFDVFMDNVNRAISTNMLIYAARNSVSRQYILITPNAIEGRASLDKDVKITRMRDPRQRGIVEMLPSP